jgi:hypothetical protein
MEGTETSLADVRVGASVATWKVDRGWRSLRLAEGLSKPMASTEETVTSGRTEERLEGLV